MRVIVFGLLATALAACSDADPSRSLGTLERDRIQLVADSNEPITRILVSEGDVVEAGDVLVEQDSRRANIALNRARADEAAARSILEKAEAGPRAQAISQARARVAAARSAVSTTKIELDRVTALFERNLISENRIDEAQGRYDEAVAVRDESQAALEELLEGTRSEEIDEARARHAAAVASVEDLTLSLERASTRAPVRGVVESLPFEIGERPGIGAPVALLLASGRTYARVHVSEPMRTRLSIGSSANVWLDGWDEPLQGELRWISMDAAYTPYFALNQHDRARLSYVAEVDVINGQDLPVGVPAEVSFTDLTE